MTTQGPFDENQPVAHARHVIRLTAQYSDACIERRTQTKFSGFVGPRQCKICRRHTNKTAHELDGAQIGRRTNRTAHKSDGAQIRPRKKAQQRPQMIMIQSFSETGAL